MYGICCCCLELPCLKSLWSEYTWMGQCEIYGEMLNECYNLSWPRLQHSKYQICEVCITLLRNALHFKQRIIQTQAKLEEKAIEITKINVQSNNKVENKLTLTSADNIDSIRFDSCHETDMLTDELPYIKDVGKAEQRRDSQESTDSSKIIKTNRRNATKKKVILKTSKRRLRIIPKESKSRNVEIYKINYIKPRQNACLILEHSTIVPFKSSRGYFTCLYCNKQHIGFDELKIHVTQLHGHVTFKSILKCITRPHDRIKADVSDITCRICKKNIDNLEMLVSHLTNHNVKFNFDDTNKPIDSILPYDLSDNKFKCYICKNDYLFFKTLSNHMNSHSNNYICDICGRCFLLPERLRAHRQMHINAKSAKCDVCGKVYASAFALKSHIRYMHKKISFICSICNQTFATYRLRMKHLEDIHKRTPLNLNCKICKKKYNTPNSLNNHMRVDHLKIPIESKYSCNICNMMFKSNNALSCHSVVHLEEKKYQCDICLKRYARAKTLTEHLKIHRNDRQWCCRQCSQKFVQKCSLKNHVRVHHADMDFEKLIVYIKPE